MSLSKAKSMCAARSRYVAAVPFIAAVHHGDLEGVTIEKDRPDLAGARAPCNSSPLLVSESRSRRVLAADCGGIPIRGVMG